jgi:hypothetical protein
VCADENLLLLLLLLLLTLLSKFAVFLCHQRQQ